MGCNFSSSRSGDLNARVFRVYNVDDQGQELSPGKIEVSDTELILMQRGKEAIRWPLRCLRRYGFDAELFSFESGRRCPTGTGIYAFKCRNAEALFNTVQDCIQRAGQEDNARVGHSMLPSSRPNSRPQSLTDTPLQPESYGVFIQGRHESESSYGSGHHYINGTVSKDLHEYINTGVAGPQTNGVIDNAAAFIHFLHNGPLPPAEPEQPEVTYAVLYLDNVSDSVPGNDEEAPRRDSATEESRRSISLAGAGPIGVEDIGAISLDDGEEGGAACPMYVNFGSEGPIAAKEKSVPHGAAAVKPKSEPNYANLDLSESCAPAWPRHKEIAKVNYIQLDLNNQTVDSGAIGSSASPTSPTSFGSVPESPCRKTESYAMIDFNKTAALSNTAKNVDDCRVDPGVRKTRHNNDLP